ncbi:MAG: transpeptidase family protein [Prevotella sp.]|nr:transpeptidase family protein [Prevotella sp.]
MSKFRNEKVIPRYLLITLAFALIGLAVVAKVLYIMTTKQAYWEQVASRLKHENDTVAAQRGNVLSADGELLAGSIPQYRVFMDFKVGGHKKDSLLGANMDSICRGLHEIFPSKSADDFRRDIEKARRDSLRHYAIWPYIVDYTTYKAVKQLPVFNLGKYRGGFHSEEIKARRHPFGSLALRIVGNIYAADGQPYSGLELSYDSLLRGTPGLERKQKVLDRILRFPKQPAVDGADIVTTIDVGMQDLAERSVIDVMERMNALVGVAVVMEVKTGDVKAIVNIDRVTGPDGVAQYREIDSHAISDLVEPGSVFKTASLMVALDDGVCDTTRMVDTGRGQWPMYGRVMKDHNWRNGHGYGVISLPRSLEVSSNIGVSRIIDDYYHNQPEKFVAGLQRIGLAEDLRIPLPRAAAPRIRMPQKNKRGQWLNWSNTALAWMSIGYETQVPPISTLTFYNAIANNGRMVRPRFVKRIEKDGNVVKEYPVEVVRERICKEKTLREVQTMLEHVVSQGLGRRAGSRSFKVAGKTGTAMMAEKMADGRWGYTPGHTRYLLSFCGYFPADEPRYSCIVCMQTYGPIVSGGLVSGTAFHQISEGIMAQTVKLRASDAADGNMEPPTVKPGNAAAAASVMSELGIGNAQLTADARVNRGLVPDVRGMGLRDAVHLLESLGMRVQASGVGHVAEQSLKPGLPVTLGQTCEIKLKN